MPRLVAPILVALALLAPARAQAPTATADLADALLVLTEGRGIGLVYRAALVRGRQTACPPARWRSLAPAEALDCVLAGTGLVPRRLASGTFSLTPASAARPDAPLATPATPASAAPAASLRRADVALSVRATDAQTGEALIGATVYADSLADDAAPRGAATNAYGYATVSVPAGAARLRVSYVGYAPQTLRLVADAPRRLDVALAPASLGAVTVEADAAGAGARPEDTPQMGQTALTGADVRALPALLGESDVLKAVQLLPGVRGGQEGTAGLYVRGGSPDQTLILLDGSPVYNAGHLFGFVSTFNADAVNAVELTRGAYPARFGGRLGAVLDVRLRDGDLYERRVTGQVGLLTSRLLVEGPLVPGRASFLVSGRRTYLDLLAAPVVASANRQARADFGEQVYPAAYFQDLNAKVNWRPTDRDRLYLSLYGGADVFRVDAVQENQRCSPPDDPQQPPACTASGTENRTGGGLDWGSVTGSARWTRAASPRVFGAVTLTASDYAFEVGARIAEEVGGPDERRAEARYHSGIRDLALRADVDVAAGRGHTLRLGGGVTLHRFAPGALSLVGRDAATAVDTLLGARVTWGTEAVAYGEDAWRLAPRVTLSLGLHAALYAVEGAAYPSAEPRVSVAWQVAPRLALKASGAVTQQPLHLLTTAGVGLPTDLWVPATRRAPPERGWQAAVGAAGSSVSGATTWTAEAYWREMRGLVAYRDGVSFSTPLDDWQDLVVTGDGRSVGAEVFVQHRTDRLTAWAGYTLAKTDRRFDAIDDGARFPYRYDRRHDLSLVAQYQLSRRWDVSATVVYGTGDVVTLPVARYDRPVLSGNTPLDWRDGGVYGFSFNGGETRAYGPRNGHRLPAYARADLGLTRYFRRGARPHALALNVYNLTNRKNPFFTALDTDTDPATGQLVGRLRGFTLFPVLPTLSYRFSF